MMRFDDLSNLWWAWIVAASWQLCLFVCIVAVACWLARPLSARLRYGLWLLVLVKVFLPPTLTAPWSVGNSAVRILPNRIADNLQTSAIGEATRQDGTIPARGTLDIESAKWNLLGEQSPAGLMFVWLAGCMGLWGIVGLRYAQLMRTLAASESIDEGPHRVLLEEIAQRLKLKRIPELFTTDIVSSPFLLGVARPRVVIPQLLIEQLSDVEMRAVLLHELTHWKRRDTWVGWLQVIAQGLFWFHPFVWWANNQLRHARESACDESVLKLEHCRPQQYGEALVRTLTASRGRSLVAGSLVGVFERGTKIQSRLEEIMNYEPSKRQFGWMSRGAIALFAALFLPMAASIAEPVSGNNVVDKPQDSTPTPYPQIVRSVPESGATGVDPAMDSITATFDRDMRKGMSWTGGPPLFPPIDKAREPQWKDDRTCVLPVKLAKGQMYRLGINSKDFQNFRSSDGTPAPPSALFFTTEGATKAIERRLRVPKVVKIVPPNGGKEIDPTIDTLRVTFDVPMGEGMSWTGGGPTFPEIPAGKRARWSPDGKTCTLPVTLKPNSTYQLGLNSLSHSNFQSKWGVPAKPVEVEFATRSAEN